jgi:hypothetical protein
LRINGTKSFCPPANENLFLWQNSGVSPKIQVICLKKQMNIEVEGVLQVKMGKLLAKRARTSQDRILAKINVIYQSYRGGPGLWYTKLATNYELRFIDFRGNFVPGSVRLFRGL